MAHSHLVVLEGWHQKQRNPWNPSLAAHKSSFSPPQRWKPEIRGAFPPLHSLVGSWQLTQVGVSGCPSFEGRLLKWKPTSLGSVTCFGPGAALRVTRCWEPAWIFRKLEVVVKKPSMVQRQVGEPLRWVPVWGTTLILVFAEVRLDCFATGSSSSSHQLDGRGAG